MHRTLLSIAAALLVVLVGSAAPLAAQSQNDATRDATARALFEDGVGLAEHAQWEEAEDRFRRAYALRSSPIIAYNLASALAERGKLVEASELLRKLTQDPSVDAELAESARGLSEQLAPRIGRLTIHVEGQAAGDVVSLDAGALLDAQLGIGIPIDPGPHRVTLVRAGATLDAQTVNLPDGARSDVTLHAIQAPTPAQVAAAAPVVAQPAPVTTTSATANDSVLHKWWFWTGVGVAATATAVVVAVVASSGSSSASAKDGFHGDFQPATLGVEVAR